MYSHQRENRMSTPLLKCGRASLAPNTRRRDAWPWVHGGNMKHHGRASKNWYIIRSIYMPGTLETQTMKGSVSYPKTAGRQATSGTESHQIARRYMSSITTNEQNKIELLDWVYVSVALCRRSRASRWYWRAEIVTRVGVCSAFYNTALLGIISRCWR